VLISRCSAAHGCVPSRGLHYEHVMSEQMPVS